VNTLPLSRKPQLSPGHPPQAKVQKTNNNNKHISPFSLPATNRYLNVENDEDYAGSVDSDDISTSLYDILEEASRNGSPAISPTQSPTRIAAPTQTYTQWKSPAMPPDRPSAPAEVVRTTPHEGAVFMATLQEGLKYDEHGKKMNTDIAYDRHIKDFYQFCDAYYSGVPVQFRYIVSPDSCYKFLNYIAFRPQKKRGRRKVVEGFDIHKFNAIFSKIQSVTTCASSSDAYDRGKKLLAEIEPAEGSGVTYSSINQAHFALTQLWLQQKELGGNSHTKDELFGHWVKQLKNYVDGRKERQKRSRFAEKVDHQSVGFGAKKNVKKLEEHLFNLGIDTNRKRTVFASLRNRMIFLFSTKGIVRGETFFNAELSDLLTFEVEKEDDMSPFMVLILQFSVGKVNKGSKLFARVGRHIDPCNCSVGAVALYLAYRFSVTREFETGDIDFSDNSTWYNIKFLTELYKVMTTQDVLLT
jgi:hypothetical protein